jgi:hypothetical protein
MNRTETRSIIINTVYPTLTIVSPAAKAYSTSTILVNLSASGAGLDTLVFFNGTDNETYNISPNTPVTITYEDGVQNLTAWVNDTVGHVTAKNVTFKVDTINPAIAFVSPDESAIYNSTTVLINISATDTNLAKVWFFNGTANETYTVPVNRIFTQGQHTIMAWANDSAGRMNSTSVAFTVDSIAPTLNMSSPANNSYSASPTVDILFTPRDSVETSIACSIYIDGTLNLSANVTNSTLYNFSIAYNDSAHTVSVTCLDDALNSVSSGTRTFTVDTMDPAIDFMDPTTNSSTMAFMIIANVSVVDANFKNLTIRLYNASGAMKGQALSTSPGYMMTFNFSALPNGVYYWNATTYDKAGRYNSTETRNATIDTTKPAVRFVSPTDNSSLYTGRNYILANATASDVNPGSLTVYIYNSTGLYNATNTTGTSLFANFTGLPNGIYYINATAFDSANNSNKTETRNITIDTTNPAITIISPLAQVYNTTTVLVSINASDTNLAKVWFFNGTANVTYTKPVNVTFTQGQHILTAWVNDSARRISSANVTFTVDSIAPALNMSSPANNSYSASENISILFTPKDNIDASIECSIYIDGTLNLSANVTNSTLYNLTAAYNDSTHTVLVTCLDNALKSVSSGTRAFTVDTVNPAIDFMASSTGSSATASAITVNISVVDANFKNLTVRIYNASGALKSQTWSTSSKYTFNFSTLPNGLYYWNATSYDKAGRYNSTETRNATIDTIKPAVRFVSPTDNSGLYTGRDYIAINATASDVNLNNVTIYLYNSTGLYNSTNGTTSPLFMNWTGLPDGTYRFNATASDNANSLSKTETRNVTVDTMNPAIDFMASSTGSSATASAITVNISVVDANFKNLTVRIYNASGALKSQTWSTSSKYTFNFSALPSGIYYWNATSYDKAGRYNSTETRNATIDITGPTILFAKPTDNSSAYSNRTYIAVNVSATDIHLNNITIYLYNSTGLYSTANNATSPVFMNWTGLPDSTYRFNATAFDSAGNMKKTETRSITIDVVSPAVSFVNPTPNESSYIPRAYMLVNVTAFDTNQNNITIVLYNATGAIVKTVTAAGNKSLYNFTALKDGAYRFNATAYDKFKHMNSTETRNVTIDTINPAIRFTTPTDNTSAYSSRPYIAINASVTDVNLNNFTIYLYNATGLYNSTSTDLFVNWTDLPDGKYRFNATAYDNANRFNKTETRNVTIDAANPAIQFTTPTDNASAYSSRPYIAINVSATDGNFANLSVYLYNSTGGLVAHNFTTAASLFVNYTGLADGLYSWSAAAYDSFGHSNSTETRNATIDATMPEIQFVNPTDHSSAYTNITYIAINASASDMNLNNITIYIYNSTRLYNSTSISGAGLFINWTGLPDGVYSINATASDSADNINRTETRVITIDTVNPEIQFVNPSENTTNYTNVAYIEANVSASDANFANLTLTVYDATGMAVRQNVTGSTGLYANYTGLVDGVYYWNVTAYDTVGKYNYTETRNVTIDTQAPTVTLYTPGDEDVRGPAPAGVFTSFKATDAVAQVMPCTVYTYNATGLYNATSISVLNSTKWNATYIYGDVGDYSWYVNCTDWAGNVGTSMTRTFAITS